MPQWLCKKKKKLAKPIKHTPPVVYVFTPVTDELKFKTKVSTLVWNQFSFS